MMATCEKVKVIAGSLYCARAMMQRHLKESFQSRLPEFIEAIKAEMARAGCDEMEAMFNILKELKGSRAGDAVFRGQMTMAACVEMIEPSSAD